jgi:hypothetical protein
MVGILLSIGVALLANIPINKLYNILLERSHHFMTDMIYSAFYIVALLGVFILAMSVFNRK